MSLFTGRGKPLEVIKSFNGFLPRGFATRDFQACLILLMGWLGWKVRWKKTLLSFCFVLSLKGRFEERNFLAYCSAFSVALMSKGESSSMLYPLFRR